MKEILLAHLKQYPQMQLQDVVKLLYPVSYTHLTLPTIA